MQMTNREKNVTWVCRNPPDPWRSPRRRPRGGGAAAKSTTGIPQTLLEKKGEKINEIAASDEVSCSFLRILHPKCSFCSFFWHSRQYKLQIHCASLHVRYNFDRFSNHPSAASRGRAGPRWPARTRPSPPPPGRRSLGSRGAAGAAEGRRRRRRIAGGSDWKASGLFLNGKKNL